MSELFSWVDNVLLPAARVNPERAFPGAKLSPKGAYWRGPCPLHGGKDPNFSVHMRTMRWRCFSQCGAEERGSLVDYHARIGGQSIPAKGKVWFHALQSAAASLSLEVPNRIKDPSVVLPALPRRMTYQSWPDFQRGWLSTLPLERSEIDALVARHIDPAKVCGLVRASPTEGALPELCYQRSKDGALIPWQSVGLKSILALYSYEGHISGLRFRRWEKSATKFPPKATGKGKGLLMNPAAVAMFETCTHAQSNTPQLVVVEGEPDFLTYLSHCDADSFESPVVGIAGDHKAFNEQYAGRVPSGTRVIIFEHPDPAGEQITRNIVNALGMRIAMGDVKAERVEMHGGD